MNNLNDSVGGANLEYGRVYYFTKDRFCCQYRAISLYEFYLPPGIYFSGDFTISAWIYLKSYDLYGNYILKFTQSWPRLDNGVIFKVLNGKISLIVYNSNITSNLTAPDSSVIGLNQWYHVAATLQNTTASLYVNGALIKSGACFKPNSLTRYENTIELYGVIDDLKIYQGALTANDVLNDYTFSSYNGTLFNSCPATTTSSFIQSPLNGNN